MGIVHRFGDDNDKETIVYHLEIFKDDGGVISMFLWMVENNKLYLWVRFNYKCPNC